MILYNDRIYGVLKQPLGTAIKGKELFIYPVVCVGLQKEMVKMATVYYQVERI